MNIVRHSGGEGHIGWKKYTRAHLIAHENTLICDSKCEKIKNIHWGILEKIIFKYFFIWLYFSIIHIYYFGHKTVNFDDTDLEFCIKRQINIYCIYNIYKGIASKWHSIITKGKKLYPSL